MNIFKIAALSFLACLACQTANAADIPSPFVSKGLEQMNRGNYNFAVDCFSKAIRQNPSDIDARRYLSASLLKMGMAKAASTQLELIIKYAPGTLNDRCMLADAYLNCGEAAQSVEQYKTALKSEPSSTLARVGLAKALMATGDWAAARSIAIDTIHMSADPRVRSSCAQILSLIKERSIVQVSTVNNS